MQNKERIDSMQAEIRENEMKIQQLKHQVQRRTNRIKHLESGERKARNHRLITRGAAVESIWPEIRPMQEQDFYHLMDVVLNLPEARSVLLSVHSLPPQSSQGSDP